MENNQKEQQEIVNEIYAYAKNLLTNEKKDPEEVKIILIKQGIDKDGASIVVKNLITEQLEKKELANKDMLYGALWCIGGIAGTVANIGFIFWGAIIFGAIQFIKGLSNAN